MAATTQTEMPLKAGRYSLIEKLGEGHLGPVYKAVDPELKQAVAVRFPGWGRIWDEADIKSVLKECAPLVTVRHPALVPVLAAGEEGGFPYIVAECTEGATIGAEAMDGPPLTVEKKLFVMIQFAEALGFAHGRGLLHGNLRPSKIVLASDGTVRIRDVGLSRIFSTRLARPAVCWGHPIYLSPEQIQGKECSIRTDVFSAGVAFYEWLTGVHPFNDASGNRALDKILNSDPAPIDDHLPDAPRGLWALLRRCLEKNPVDRFETMEEFACAGRVVLDNVISDSHIMLSELLAVLRPLRFAAGRPGANPVLQRLLRDVEGLSTGTARSDYVALDLVLSRLIEQYPAVRAASSDIDARESAGLAMARGAASIEPQVPSGAVAPAPVPQPVRDRNQVPCAPAVPPPVTAAPTGFTAEGGLSPGPLHAPPTVSPSTPAVPPALPAALPPAPATPSSAQVEPATQSHRPATIVVARKRKLPPYARAAILLCLLLIVVAGYLAMGARASGFLNAVWSRSRQVVPILSGLTADVSPGPAAEGQAVTPQIPLNQSRAAILVEEADRLHIVGKDAECRTLIARALEIEPSQERALALMKELDEATPVDADLRQALAVVSAMIDAAQLPSAKAQLDRLQRQYPDEPAVVAERRRLNARSAKDAKDQARRDQEQKEADQKLQKIDEQWSARVRMLLKEGKYDDAGRDISQWLALAPGSPGALALRAKVAEADRGIRAFEDAYKAKHYQEALAALAAVEQANPSDVNIVELRRRVEASRASARSSLSVYRLGPRGSILLDGKQLGPADEIQNESIPIGNHMLVVRGETIGSVSRALECLDGQKIVLVYDLKKQFLRPMEAGDQQLLAQRRAAEESRSFDVEHSHGVFRGSCRGSLLVALPEIEFKPAAGTHRFRHPFRQLKLSVDGRAILLADAASSQEVFSFKAISPGQADELRKIWDRLKVYAR